MVDFKMTKEGLILVIKDYVSTEEMINALVSKLTQMSSFCAKGDQIVLLVENHAQHAKDIPMIVERIRDFGLNVMKILIGDERGGDINISGKMCLVKQEEAKSGTKIIKRNLRSGQVIVHSGDIIIAGNLHSGAEIMAGGSVVVFGKAEGIIRAGLNEGYSSVIMAIELKPTFLQISDKISHEKGPRGIPSVAHVRAGRIVIEKWNEATFEEVVKR